MFLFFLSIIFNSNLLAIGDKQLIDSVSESTGILETNVLWI
ncbi:MAG: Uncharacterised protein [Crocinitomicaceae bacterium]|nr:MAG: Uncharacterised protein [Crocinitomicaceae bacterium]